MQSISTLAIVLGNVVMLFLSLKWATEILENNVRNIESEFRKHQCGSWASTIKNLHEAFDGLNQTYSHLGPIFPSPESMIAAIPSFGEMPTDCEDSEVQTYQQNPNSPVGPNWHYRLYAR